MRCNNCGKDIPDKSQFCNFCGQKQPSDVIAQKTLNEPITETIDKPVNKGKLFLVLGVIIIIIAFIIAMPIINTNKKYNEAVLEAQQGNHYKAASMFSEIKDKKERNIQEFVDNFTIELCEATQFMDASMWLLYAEDEHLISNSKLAELRNIVDYREAEYLITIGNYTDAYYHFRSLENYEDSANRAEEIWQDNKDAFYELAVSNYNSGNGTNIRIAEEQFVKLGDYTKNKKANRTALQKIWC